MPVVLPNLDPRITWSIRVLDATTAPDPDVLAEHTPDVVCRTASVGKLFLLVEVANRLVDGSLDATDRIEIPDELRVEDSGLLYRMLDQRLTVADAALLVGAVSDNLATNALAHLVGLDAVHAVAARLGYHDTLMLDYIRDERTPDLPWTTSYGCARELADLALRLGEGPGDTPGADLLPEEVRSRVLSWLAADTDTSMLADSFLLDPLAHVAPEYQGIVLRHKTGSVSTARIEVGHAAGPAGRVAYAMAANWSEADGDLRAVAIDAMRATGERIRAHITGVARDGSPLEGRTAEVTGERR